MENIRIQSLRLENFKCHKSLRLDFGGENAAIYGDNATGKTSVYDALTWLLFGKDSAGNGEKNMEVKPLDSDGNVRDHQAVTEVEAVFRVNGEEVALKRTYQEIWATRRGSSEATFEGNTSEYYVDGVPCKKNAYQARVAELVDEEKFRLLTSVNYFADMLPWQKRREILFDLFGVAGDREIMSSDARFDALAEACGKMTLDDFKKVLTQKRKGYLVTRNEVPARISEQQKTMDSLNNLDFDGADTEIQILRARQEQLSSELLSIQQNSAVDGKRLELREARLELDQLNAENQRFRDEQKRSAPSADSITRELENAKRSLRYAQTELESRRAEVKRIGDQIQEARDNWKQVNAQKFTGGTCPTCGQVLPEWKLQEAVAAFEADKQRKLARIVAESDLCKRRKQKCETEMAEIQGRISNLAATVSDLEAKVVEARAAQAGAVIRDMEGYAGRTSEIQAWMKRLQKELDELQLDAGKTAAELRRRISEVKDKIADASQIAGKRAALEYAKTRIAQLKKDAAEAGEALGQVEKLLYLMEEFSRYKATFVESSVNDRFRLARFRLFREQANGGTEDRCDVVYDGVPYMGLNNGMKINVGIDIINTLSRAYGVRVPLFVDNAESVTALEKTGGQLIRLVVSEQDKELRLQHEN